MPQYGTKTTGSARRAIVRPEWRPISHDRPYFAPALMAAAAGVTGVTANLPPASRAVKRVSAVRWVG